MNGSGSPSCGIAPFFEEQLTIPPAAQASAELKNPFQKFLGAEPNDLRLTETLMKHLSGMSQKSILREYRKLPSAFQQAMSFSYELGWPAVDLLLLFLGTSCPDNCLFKGAAVLAEEGCSRVRHKALINPLRLRERHLTEKDLDDLLDSTQDLAGLISALAGRMDQDLRSSSRYLPKDERAILENLIFEIQEHQMESERSELRDKILQFYKKIRIAIFNGKKKKKSSAGVVKEQTGEKPKKSAGKKDGEKERKLWRKNIRKTKPRCGIWQPCFGTLNFSEKYIVS